MTASWGYPTATQVKQEPVRLRDMLGNGDIALIELHGHYVNLNEIAAITHESTDWCCIRLKNGDSIDIGASVESLMTLLNDKLNQEIT